MASSPPNSGMTRSIKVKSGLVLLNALTASEPSEASWTIQPSFLNKLESIIRMTLESSTIKTFLPSKGLGTNSRITSYNVCYTKLLRETNLPVHVAEDPLTCVVRGTGKILEDIAGYRKVLY